MKLCLQSGWELGIAWTQGRVVLSLSEYTRNEHVELTTDEAAALVAALKENLRCTKLHTEHAACGTKRRPGEPA